MQINTKASNYRRYFLHISPIGASGQQFADRLQQICEIEQVPSDTRAFGVLYEMTEGDMRSCLNTLQFIKNKSKTDGAQSSTTTSLSSGKAGGLTVDTLNKATIGRKDQNKSLFSVWEELFQAPYARKSRSALKVLEEGRDGLVKGIVLQERERKSISTMRPYHYI